jgi:hypothetical protein
MRSYENGDILHTHTHIRWYDNEKKNYKRGSSGADAVLGSGEMGVCGFKSGLDVFPSSNDFIFAR